jgi:hypothetical protein
VSLAQVVGEPAYYGLLVWLVLNDRVQPSFIAGVRLSGGVVSPPGTMHEYIPNSLIIFIRCMRAQSVSMITSPIH